MTSSVVWRSIVAALVALVVAIGVRAFFDGGTDDPAYEEVVSDETALDPGDATLRAPVGTAIAVRGYVYDDGAFLQLCDTLSDDDPPRCVGPSLLLRGLDIARLALTDAEVDGTAVLYTEEPVTLGGTVDGTQLDVVEVLSG